MIIKIAVFVILLLLFYELYFSIDYWSIVSFRFTHNSLYEIIWTTSPAIWLYSLTGPSFALLYSTDEIIESRFTFKLIGYQWYWLNETSDFFTCLNHKFHLKFNSYILTSEYLNHGLIRLLETTKRIAFPNDMFCRLLVSSNDVIHCWVLCSISAKMDAILGRLNLIIMHLKRLGTFFGQCSEICGSMHGYMPCAFYSVFTEVIYFLIINTFY